MTLKLRDLDIWVDDDEETRRWEARRQQVDRQRAALLIRLGAAQQLIREARDAGADGLGPAARAVADAREWLKMERGG